MHCDIVNDEWNVMRAPHAEGEASLSMPAENALGDMQKKGRWTEARGVMLIVTAEERILVTGKIEKSTLASFFWKEGSMTRENAGINV